MSVMSVLIIITMEQNKALKDMQMQSGDQQVGGHETGGAVKGKCIWETELDGKKNGNKRTELTVAMFQYFCTASAL